MGRATTARWPATRGAWLPGALLLALLLVGCGRAAGGEVVTGPLRAGDLNYWLVGTTLVAIGGAEIGGEPSGLGATVRAEGRREADGVFVAKRITVGAADPGAGASLPRASASGVVEARDPATGRWRIAGRQVQLAPGGTAPGDIAVGGRATASGYALPDGVLLASSIVAEIPATTPTATRAVPNPAATRPVPTVTSLPIGPGPEPTKQVDPGTKPEKPKEPRGKPQGDDGDD